MDLKGVYLESEQPFGYVTWQQVSLVAYLPQKWAISTSFYDFPARARNCRRSCPPYMVGFALVGKLLLGSSSMFAISDHYMNQIIRPEIRFESAGLQKSTSCSLEYYKMMLSFPSTTLTVNGV